MITDLYIHRSYVRCVSDGYRWLAKNLAKVSKVMVPYFLCFSIVFVLSNAVNTHANVAILAGKQIFIEEVIAAIILGVLSFITYIVALARMLKMFKQMFGISAKLKGNIGRAIKGVFRHFGKVLGTTLLALFIACVLSVVVYLPYVVSTYAYFSSIEAQVNFGDTAEISNGGYAVMLATCAICYTIINIISVGFYASLLFLYGSLRAGRNA